MINLDKRILSVLEKRGISTQKGIEEYLSPSISFLRDPFLLSGMREAVDRINRAIDGHETIVIYGDYDTDGVSAAAILYRFLKSRGVEANVFIPNRFEDGYGLSQETIEYITESLFPELLITVDCGITAIAETEQLSELGVDVIITDHHIPGDEIPKALAVVDPKICSETYGFDGLCGAGVALKLVQALGGNAEDFVDIAGVATIGDIVPLIDENRVLAALGLNKINAEKCCKGLLALKNLTAPNQKLTSQEASFKIVPRLNATGRMRDSILSFRLLVTDDEREAENLAREIDRVNSERMDAISSSVEEIRRKLLCEDLTKTSAIIVESPKFHIGVLGIIASRISSEYGVPSFIFNESEDGMLKGSCRSFGEYDIHEALMQVSDLCENIGGHKFAAGLSIKKQNFALFKSRLSQIVAKDFKKELAKEPDYDFEITEKDITLSFAKQFAAMEPTGCGNERLVLCLSANGCTYKQTSSPKHYQLITPHKKYVMCFSGERYKNIFACKNAKAFVNLYLEIYNNEERPKCILKDAYAPQIDELPQNNDLCLVESMYHKTENEINLLGKKELMDKAKVLIKRSGTIVLARTKSQFDFATKELSIRGVLVVPTSQESVVLYAPTSISAEENLSKYQNIVLLGGAPCKYSPFCFLDTFSYENKPNVSKDRKIFSDCFRLFSAKKPKQFNNLFEYVNGFANELPYDAAQILFCLLVFNELGFFDIEEANGLVCVKAKNKLQKRELSESSIFNAV